VLSRSAADARMIPGEQNPHWIAPSSMNARCTGWSCPSRESPSIVVLDLGREYQAAVPRFAVDEHRAGAAVTGVATFLRPGQV
jgi:hypothetical protein